MLVSGAGIVSLALAWRLQRNGAQVAIVDPEPPGDGGASFGNAGAISSTSVVPLAMPGLLKQVPRMRSIHRRRCVCHCAIGRVLRHGCCALAAPAATAIAAHCRLSFAAEPALETTQWSSTRTRAASTSR